MSRDATTEFVAPLAASEDAAAALLRPLLATSVSSAEANFAPVGVVVGELIAMTDEGKTPLVLYTGQPGSAALPARTVVDLHGAHIGRPVALMFEGGNPHKPIVMGVLREGAGWPLSAQPGEVKIDLDGERLTVSARAQLVLRCGKASITLTRAGKVLIQGTYVLSRSSGINRVKGGSINLN